MGLESNNRSMSKVKATRTVVVGNPNGLHLRPIEQLAKLAGQFDAQIEVINESVRADAKSVLNILTLGAEQGTTLVLEATGHDAESALCALAEFVESNFEENETTGQEQSR